MILTLFIVIFSLIGAPVFAILAGSTQIAWWMHPDPDMRLVRFLAPDVLDERFAGSPVMVTVPLFTFLGYMMAESRTPERIVRASNAFFGWMPGGLAIVCVFASAFFTTLTGGSAVTIVAIGALLYPALIQKGYPKDYSLGLIMTGGSLGLLLPPSVPILVYSLVAGIDFTKAFKAGIIPGFLVIAIISAHAAYIGVKSKIPRNRANLKDMGGALWMMKWELGIPALILGGLATGLTEIDESAAFAAAYVIFIEIYIYKDLTWKDIPRIVGNSIALAGAVILIMAAAQALTNYIISEQIPDAIFEWVTSAGVTKPWHFLITLNIFLYILGAVMDGFSSILVAVPLLIPFAAEFQMSPFHLAMMFLLNLEIAYLSPPLGQNLFVTAFRFNVPMVHLFKVCVPFMILLTIGLVILMVFPGLSTMSVEGDIRRARAIAAGQNERPRESWMMECVQEDRNNPLPCTEEDRKKFGKHADDEPAEKVMPKDPDGTDSATPQGEDVDEEDEALLKEMMGEGADAAAGDAGDAGAGEKKPKKKETEEEEDERLMKEMMQ